MNRNSLERLTPRQMKQYEKHLKNREWWEKHPVLNAVTEIIGSILFLGAMAVFVVLMACM